MQVYESIMLTLSLLEFRFNFVLIICLCNFLSERITLNVPVIPSIVNQLVKIWIAEYDVDSQRHVVKFKKPNTLQSTGLDWESNT